jgi:hypothetical protein
MQFMLAASYAAVVVLTPAATAFSSGDWLFMLLPPFTFGIAAMVGLRYRVPRVGFVRCMVSLTGNVLTVCGFLLVCLYVPLGIFGSFMDWTIG